MSDGHLRDDHKTVEIAAEGLPGFANATSFITRLVAVLRGNGWGVFDHLPEGYSNSSKAIRALEQGLAENYGHAYRRYIRRLMRRYNRDKDQLIKQISDYERIFLKHAGGPGNSGTQDRVVGSFATIYAATKLAADLNVLPLENIGEAILACYRRTLIANVAPTAIDRIRKYVEAHRGDLIDLDQEPLPRLSDKRLHAHPGFLKTRRGRRCLFIRTERWDGQFGHDAHRLLTELRDANRLQTTDGLQLQTKVRLNRQKDRVYAIVLT